MASILNVDKIRATGSTNDAIEFTSGGAAKTNSIFVSAGVTGLQTVTTDTDTLVNYDDQIHSNGLTWDTTNKRCVFDATTAGRYMITIGIAFFSAGNNMEAAFIKPHLNGAGIRNTIVLQNGQTPAALGSLRHIYGQSHLVQNFASGDIFNVYARIDVASGGAHFHERQYGSEIMLTRIGD